VSQDNLAIGADIHHQHRPVAFENPRHQDAGGGIAADETADDGEQIDHSAGRDPRRYGFFRARTGWR